MKLKTLVNALPLILSIFAAAIALGTLINESNEQTNRTITLGSTQQDAPQVLEIDGERVVAVDSQELANLLDQVQDIQSEAQSAANSADTILSFIEGGSILIGALIAIAVVAFGSSIQDVRSQLEASISDAEERFDTTEARLDDIIAEIQSQVQESIDTAEKRLQASELRMENLTGRIEDSIRDTESTVEGLHAIVNDAVESAKQDAENSFRVLSLLLLAEQQVRARNRQTAISTLQEAYEIDPDNQTTNYLLGYLYVGRKQFHTAIEHLQRALEQDPNFAPALAAMGLAQRRMGDVEEDTMKKRQLWAQAELNLNKALAQDDTLIDADNESYFGTLGGLYRRQGRNQEALHSYEQAVKITPNNSYPVGNLATLYKKFGHEEQAQKMFERAVEISEAILDDHPGDTWARLDLAQAFLATGHKEEALAQYQNVIERINEPSPLEAAYSGLDFLTDVPQPLDGIEEAKKLLVNAINRLQSQPPRERRQTDAVSD